MAEEASKKEAASEAPAEAPKKESEPVVKETEMAQKEASKPAADDTVEEVLTAGTKKEVAARLRKKEEEEGLTEQEVMISRHLQRQRARRKQRSKKLQYQFLFKAGAFLVMLIIVLVTKQINAWWEGGKEVNATDATCTTKDCLEKQKKLEKPPFGDAVGDDQCEDKTAQKP